MLTVDPEGVQRERIPPVNDPPATSRYPFRPWVRSTCRRAMIWGVGVVALLGLVAWLFRTPGSAPLGRAFGVLAGYGLLFWLTLLKVWWTAGLPAVEVDGEAIAYQPLHTFRLRRVPWDRILASADYDWPSKVPENPARCTSSGRQRIRHGSDYYRLLE